MKLLFSSPLTINANFSCALTASDVYVNSSTTILYAENNQLSHEEVVDEYTHFTLKNESKLLKLLSQFKRYFSKNYNI